MKPFNRIFNKYRRGAGQADKEDDDVLDFFEDYPETIFDKKVGNGILSISISSNGEYLVSGSSDKKISLFNGDGELLWNFETDEYVWGVCVSKKGDRIIGASRKLYAFDESGELNWDYDLKGMAYSVSMANGNIVVSTDKNQVHLLTNEGIPLWVKDMGAVRGVSMAPNGTVASVLALYGLYEKVKLHNTKGKMLWSRKINDYMWGVSISSDGRYIAAGSSDKNIYLFNNDGRILWSYETGNYVWGVSISSRGRYIAAGSSDKNIYLLNRNGKMLWKHETEGNVMDTSISPDGKYIAAGSIDGKIYLLKFQN